MEKLIVEKEKKFDKDGVIFSCRQRYLKNGDGVLYEDESLIDENLLARADGYRKAAGLLTSGEIRQIREIYHLSAKDFAKMLDLGEINITRYETKAVQTKSINDIILRSKTDPLWFLEKFEEYAKNLSPEKTKEVEKAIVNYAASKEITMAEKWHDIAYAYLPYRAPSSLNGQQSLSLRAAASIAAAALKHGIALYKVKFAKLLFYCDFLNFQKNGRSITGFVYTHAPYGALPVAFDAILANPLFALSSKLLIIDEKECLSTLVSTPMKNTLGPKEKETVEEVLTLFEKSSAAELSSHMHGEEAYQKTVENETIDYRFAAQLRDF